MLPSDGRNAQVVGGHRAHQRLLVEVEAHHRLDVGVDELVVGHPAAEGVHARQPAGAAGIQEHVGQPGGAAVLVVQPVLVGAPVDHVHLAAAAVDRARRRPRLGYRSSGVTSGMPRRRASTRCSYQALLPGPSESSTT